MTDSADNATVYHSAGFSVYPLLGQVRFNSQKLSLGPVNMKVLMVLLENQGEVISRSGFYEQVWGNQVVSDDALTRCISDLRIQLGKFTHERTLIETLPKRGYRWLAEVTQGCGSLPVTDEQAAQGEIWKQNVLWVIVSIVFLFVLSTGFLWVWDTRQPDSYIHIALLPVQADSPEQQELAARLDALLRSQLLETRDLRFQSDKALGELLNNPYPGLFRDLGTQWVIEGQIRQINGNTRLSLTLVDARTALVSFEKNADISSDGSNVETISADFIRQLSGLLGKTTQ